MSQGPPIAKAFVPFHTGTSDERDPETAFRPKVVPASGPNPTVAPKSIQAADQPSAADPAAAAPLVTVQRDGDKVTGVRIECVCGQVIELACVY